MIQINVDFADEQFREILRQEVEKAMADVIRKNELPPMLTKKELMNLLRIKDTKASELLNRPDFPVFREAGVLIPTHLLFQWIEKNTRWVEENSNYFNRAI
ncbi:DNA-binding protein [Heyndrickxia coagulans]|uniref:DNA-binding protein n=1 Tax=Heyndrickxia coagulans TaxID=1398 RepID=UPI0014595FEB|nr:DNA-binding protein [Heyndrickxia coagulans]MED4936285.1 DNA-binding protein [Heyndrickxia coagulans]NMH83298.1 DNA-binding protein [Heyndrickxia coagulans]